MPRFVISPEISPELFDDLLDCWVDVTNAGGAVGWVPPVSADDIGPTATTTFAACADGGPDTLVVGFDDDGRVACWAVLVSTGHSLMTHWRTVMRVMVHPKHQGEGYGGELMRAVAEAGTRLGLESLRLTARGGLGLEQFYARHGYREVGRVPRAIRVAEGDDRDEIYMVTFLPENA
ncbi:GNAT family N-acetyltransferase [Nonomuraea mangrovi]|uniref:GNAT family N-acetyltransferase n=1 Tax=Nonomuraea mangrovi TaxID=2316207 RepID=A0ABW4SQ82_9ACTN